MNVRSFEVIVAVISWMVQVSLVIYYAHHGPGGKWEDDISANFTGLLYLPINTAIRTSTGFSDGNNHLHQDSAVTDICDFLSNSLVGKNSRNTA